MRHTSFTRSLVAVTLFLLDCCVAVAADAPAAGGPAVNEAAVDKAFEAIKTFDWGTDYKTLAPIDDAVALAMPNAATTRRLEARLAAVLGTDASRAAKDYACRKLRIIGTAQSVHALAALLADKDLSHMARYALERMPCREAGQALREALPKVQGDLKVGVIASLGARRDTASTAMLAILLGYADKKIACAAACALGDIGNAEAGKALGEFAKTAPVDVKSAAFDAYLVCADRMLSDGKSDEAMSIFKSLNGNEQPSQVHLASIVGMLKCAAAGGQNENYTAMVTALLKAHRDVGSVGLDEVPSWAAPRSHGPRDVRDVGLNQIRYGAKAAGATQAFVSLLPKLPPEVKVELLDALATRGDKAARPAIVALLGSDDQQVRLAAIKALGPLGEAEDVPTLVKMLAAENKDVRDAATDSLGSMEGVQINPAIVASIKQAKPELAAQLIDVLGIRRAVETVPIVLEAAKSDSEVLRSAAIAMLGKLAGPEHVPDMLQCVLKAKVGTERDDAEKTVMMVCERSVTSRKASNPMIAAMAKLSEDDQTALLPTLGRVGGREALKVVEAAIADKNQPRHEAGLRALCNWPDATVADRLAELAETSAEPDTKLMALRAFIRVSVLQDKRMTAEKLALLKKAMTIATRADERKLVLQRAASVQTIEALRFVAPYMDEPALTEEACRAVVTLAHATFLREPNKAEFDKALDTVIRTSKNARLKEEADRYKKGQT